jgi:hypothetical protein
MNQFAQGTIFGLACSLGAAVVAGVGKAVYEGWKKTLEREIRLQIESEKWGADRKAGHFPPLAPRPTSHKCYGVSETRQA